MKKVLSIIIMSTVLFICCAFHVFASEVNTQAIDAGGYKLLKVIQSIGFWIIVLKGVYDTIKNAMNHDRKAVGDTIISYMIIASAMYGIPAAVRMIRDFFS